MVQTRIALISAITLLLVMTTLNAVAMGTDGASVSYEWTYKPESGPPKVFNTAVTIHDEYADAYFDFPYRYRFDYSRMITINDPAVISVANKLDEMAVAEGYADEDRANFALAFVQKFEYTDDNDTHGRDYPQLPGETLLIKTGDCEDKSMLFMAIGTLMQFDIGLVLLPDDHHMAAGVHGDAFSGEGVVEEGQVYCFAETTSPGHKIGHIPNELAMTSSYLVFRANSEYDPLHPPDDGGGDSGVDSLRLGLLITAIVLGIIVVMVMFSKDKDNDDVDDGDPYRRVDPPPMDMRAPRQSRYPSTYGPPPRQNGPPPRHHAVRPPTRTTAGYHAPARQDRPQTGPRYGPPQRAPPPAQGPYPYPMQQQGPPSRYRPHRELEPVPDVHGRYQRPGPEEQDQYQRPRQMPDRGPPAGYPPPVNGSYRRPASKEVPVHYEGAYQNLYPPQHARDDGTVDHREERRLPPYPQERARPPVHRPPPAPTARREPVRDEPSPPEPAVKKKVIDDPFDDDEWLT